MLLHDSLKSSNFSQELIDQKKVFEKITIFYEVKIRLMNDENCLYENCTYIRCFP